MSRDKYSSQVLYLSRDMPRVLYFLHMSSGGAIYDTLYFKILMSCKQQLWFCTWSGQVKQWILQMMHYTNEGK